MLRGVDFSSFKGSVDILRFPKPLYSDHFLVEGASLAATVVSGSFELHFVL